MNSSQATGRSGRRAEVFQLGRLAGILEEGSGGAWAFRYIPGYSGPPVSLTIPVGSRSYEFDSFPPVFEGLLPEGPQLEALLRRHKIDRNDLFRQLVIVGGDLVGSISVREIDGDVQAESK